MVLKSFFMLTLWSAVLAVALAGVYSFAISFGSEKIVAVAVVNTLYALPIVWLLWRKSSVISGSSLHFFSLKNKIFGDLAPAGALVGSALLGALATRFFLPGATLNQGYSALYLCKVVIWIPLVEELVFRVGFGGMMRGAGGALLGSYFSALFFGLMHSLPTVDRVISLHFGIAIGPFLLGLVCEYLYAKRGRVLPIVLFHGACNATPLIFGVVDGRWLHWLALLYSSK